MLSVVGNTDKDFRIFISMFVIFAQSVFRLVFCDEGVAAGS